MKWITKMKTRATYIHTGALRADPIDGFFVDNTHGYPILKEG